MTITTAITAESSVKTSEQPTTKSMNQPKTTKQATNQFNIHFINDFTITPETVSCTFALTPYITTLKLVKGSGVKHFLGKIMCVVLLKWDRHTWYEMETKFQLICNDRCLVC